MKLIVTIPAYNEEESIAQVIKSIPRTIKGIDTVEVLVVSDGSTDQTVATAKKAGAEYVLENSQNVGLAQTFQRMMEEAYQRGADVVVNTDADNQYDQSEIPVLIQPILQGKADMVLGDRQVKTLDHMPPSKKIGNIIGSWTIRLLSGSQVNDASTGFRAFSREYLRKLTVYSAHTYTHETIIHAAYTGFRVAEVPITFRKRTYGESRLISGIIPHIQKSGVVIVRSLLMYQAYKVLVITGSLFMIVGLGLMIRFLMFYFTEGGSGMIQSLIFASILMSIGFSTIVTGVLADQIKVNRILIERILDNQRK
jgi:glycosyltransferase involved in cell wall biosynthesis